MSRRICPSCGNAYSSAALDAPCPRCGFGRSAYAPTFSPAGYGAPSATSYAPGAPPPPPPPPAPEYGSPPVAQKTNGFAVASLACGLLFFFPIMALLALVFGIVAIAQIKKRGGQGLGMAIAGTILGALVLVVAVLFFGFAPFWF